jgi:hypothetical protein
MGGSNAEMKLALEVRQERAVRRLLLELLDRDQSPTDFERVTLQVVMQRLDRGNVFGELRLDLVGIGHRRPPTRGHAAM